MIFARFWDILADRAKLQGRGAEPAFQLGILEYIAVPGALFSFWLVYYFSELKRPSADCDQRFRILRRFWSRLSTPDPRDRSWTRRRMPTMHRCGKVTKLRTQTPVHHGVSGGAVHLGGRFFVFCFGMGKVINNGLDRADGALTSGTRRTRLRRGRRSVESGAGAGATAKLTQQFPTPRLETDDGNQDLADLHEREDLLLSYYSWIDRSKGTVRIPIERRWS